MGNFNEDKKYHFIYKTTNLLNEKFYIGMHSTNDLDDGYCGSGKRLKRSIAKYGKENFAFEILEYLPDRESLTNRERELVNSELISNELCMNLMIGGKGGRGFISDEQQAHRSKCGGLAHREKILTDPEYREKTLMILKSNVIQAHKDGKMKYDNFKGKHHNDTTRLKMSEKAKERTGGKNSQFNTCWINNGVENKKIKKDILDIYLKSNWVVGRLATGTVGMNQYNK